jgi:hypothetical protein
LQFFAHIFGSSQVYVKGNDSKWLEFEHKFNAVVILPIGGSVLELPSRSLARDSVVWHQNPH